MRCFSLHVFGLNIYLVLVLLKVALVNFTLNEYMMMTILAFVEDTKETFLLWQQPLLQPWHPTHVGTGAYHQQAKHYEAVERIYCNR